MRRLTAGAALLALAACVTPDIEIEDSQNDVITLKVTSFVSYTEVETFATQACSGDRAAWLARDTRPGDDEFVYYKFKCQRVPTALRGFK